MTELPCSVDNIVLAFDVVVFAVEVIKAIGALRIVWRVLEGDSATKVPSFWSSLGPSGNLSTRTGCRRGGGRCRLPGALVALAAAAVPFSLNFRGNRREEWGGEVGVREFGGLGDNWVGEEGGGGGYMPEADYSIVEVTFLRPFQLGHFLECEGEDGGKGSSLLLKFSL